MKEKVIALAAGGTGGHIFPALCVAEKLKELGNEVVFLGTGNELEKRLVQGRRYELFALRSRAFVGKSLLNKLLLIISVPSLVFNAMKILRKKKVSAIIGFGGYPSVFPLLASWLLGKPVFIQEQNAQVGLANRFLSIFAHRIYAVPSAKGFLKKFWPAKKLEVTRVQNPVRDSFYALSAPEYPAQFTASRPLRMLILGGSQGARSLNLALPELIKEIERELGDSFHLELIHQTGAAQQEEVKEFYGESEKYRAEAFIEDIVSAYSFSDLVVCRSGAMTVSEVLVSKRPAIFIPLSISKGHQKENARELVSLGASFIVEQEEGYELVLKKLIRELYQNPAKLAEMSDKASKAMGAKRPAELIAGDVSMLAAQDSQ